MPGIHSMEDLSKIKVKDACRTFLKSQELRIQTYNIFEKGFKDYLNDQNGQDFISFKKLAYDVTCEFNKISKQIIEVESLLKSIGTGDALNAANLIEVIQSKEQEQLEKTIEMFLSQKDEKDEVFKESDYFGSKIVEYRAKLQGIRESITENTEEVRLILMDI
ncbi:uncharacterized protein LOC136031578 isoform X1 [Artemia franciscana]|uniref:uncharacterized protein LOC136031578 isoform X1 n=1 Tax=Artemia franciscana TaxID=6661 RepID=UPI0032DB043D